MKFFCKVCGTESPECAICSGCGSFMVMISDTHLFVLEIIDQVVSREAKETVVYERRGPFDSANAASEWWNRNQGYDKYVGCTGVPALLEPPVQLDIVDEDTN